MTCAARKALEKGLCVVWPIEADTSYSTLEALAGEYERKIIPFAPLLSTPRSLHLERIVRGGELGEIGTVTHHRTQNMTNTLDMKSDALSLALNDIALIRRFFGDSSQVFATHVTTPPAGRSSGTDFLTVCLALKNGAIASVVCHVGESLAARFSFDYSGCRGNLIHDGEEGLTATNLDDSLDEWNGVETAWMELLLRLRENKSPAYSVEEWLEDLKTIQAIRVSAETFKPQTLAGGKIDAIANVK
ncbi:MAG: hypothetical protein LBT65_03530 [Synergistaceae bacterium]|nr:hypothetical protein [Synergistaceae bacterium]